MRSRAAAWLGTRVTAIVRRKSARGTSGFSMGRPSRATSGSPMVTPLPGSSHDRRTACPHAARLPRVAALGLLGCVLLTGDPAAAADPTPTPSPKELWEAYPLHPNAATPTPVADRGVSAPDADQASDGGGAAITPVLIAVLLVLGATLRWCRKVTPSRASRSKVGETPGCPTASARKASMT